MFLQRIQPLPIARFLAFFSTFAIQKRMSELIGNKNTLWILKKYQLTTLQKCHSNCSQCAVDYPGKDKCYKCYNLSICMVNNFEKIHSSSLEDLMV